MNFLLEEDKKEIKREYCRRFVTVLGVFSLSVFLIGTVFLASIIISLKLDANALARQSEFTQQRFEESGAKSFSPLIQDLNDKINFIARKQAKIRENSLIIKKIIGAEPEGIKINSLSLNGGKLVLQGYSNTRQNLVFLIDRLKQTGFEKVESPLSNIIKERDIEFTINIQL